MEKHSKVSCERVITIRPAVKDDIYYGLLDCFSTFDGVVSIEQAECEFEARKSQAVKTFVACEDDKEVLGTVSLLVKPGFTHGGRAAAIIEDVITRPEYRHVGVASLLIKYAISYCRQRNFYKIILNCRKELEPFYAKFGFVPHERELRLDL